MEIFKCSSILVLFLVLDAASALYFHIAEGERKCFIEEVPDDTTVIGKNNPGLFLASSFIFLVFLITLALS